MAFLDEFFLAWADEPPNQLARPQPDILLLLLGEGSSRNDNEKSSKCSIECREGRVETAVVMLIEGGSGRVAWPMGSR